MTEPSPRSTSLLLNFRQGFAKTVTELIAEGQPFTSTVTTTRYRMTTAMMTYYAYADSSMVTDATSAGAGSKLCRFFDDDPNWSFQLTAKDIALGDSGNPASPNYLSFSFPTLAAQYSVGSLGEQDAPTGSPSCGATGSGRLQQEHVVRPRRQYVQLALQLHARGQLLVGPRKLVVHLLRRKQVPRPAVAPAPAHRLRLHRLANGDDHPGEDPDGPDALLRSGRESHEQHPRASTSRASEFTSRRPRFSPNTPPTSATRRALRSIRR